MSVWNEEGATAERSSPNTDAYGSLREHRLLGANPQAEMGQSARATTLKIATIALVLATAAHAHAVLRRRSYDAARTVESFEPARAAQDFADVVVAAAIIVVGVCFVVQLVTVARKVLASRGRVHGDVPHLELVASHDEDDAGRGRW